MRFLHLMELILKFLRWDLPAHSTQDHLICIYRVPYIKHLQSVIICECFLEKKRILYFFSKNKKMNADPYLQVLEEHMLNCYCIYGSKMFIHSNAPHHKAKQIIRSLKKKQINIFEWPGHIFNLNYIKL